MHYNTIVIQLLQDDYPTMHDCLRKNRTLLQTTNEYTLWLECHHVSWLDRLGTKGADRDPIQIASDALELAIEDLRADISLSGSTLNGPASGSLSLFAAMAFVRRTTLAKSKTTQVPALNSPHEGIAACQSDHDPRPTSCLRQR